MESKSSPTTNHRSLRPNCANPSSSSTWSEFWECHETLEDVWRESPYPFRLFYHAVIKTAVGFHHLTVHNRHGARVKLRDGVELLELFQPEWMGVRTDLLLTDAKEWLSFVEAPDRRVGRARPPQQSPRFIPSPLTGEG